MATVPALALIRKGHKSTAAGLSPIELKRASNTAVKAAVEELKQLAQPCDDAQSIGPVTAVPANWHMKTWDSCPPKPWWRTSRPASPKKALTTWTV